MKDNSAIRYDAQASAWFRALDELRPVVQGAIGEKYDDPGYSLMVLDMTFKSGGKKTIHIPVQHGLKEATEYSLQYVMELMAQGYRLFPIRGNHEEMFVKASADRGQYRSWILNGGYAALDSFQVNDASLVPPQYYQFCSDLPYYYLLDDYLIVHAGFNAEAEEPYADTMAMLWNRTRTVSKELLGGRTLICGHTPQPLREIEKMIRDGLDKDWIINPQVSNPTTKATYDGTYANSGVLGKGQSWSLGFTQKGRIEAALAGRKINTDALDNSAGVDTSDHEVNIKIALGDAVRRGGLSVERRDRVLASMTDDVAALVLRH